MLELLVKVVLLGAVTFVWGYLWTKVDADERTAGMEDQHE